MQLIVRMLLGLGGVVTGWFVAEDSPNFGVIQGLLGIAALAAVVIAIAFWPRRKT